MIKAIIITTAAVFAALGMCDFIHILKSAFLVPDVKTNTYSVLVLRRGHALSQLRFFSYKLRWYGSEYCEKIIAVTDDLDDSEVAACENYCYNSGIYLCRFEDVTSKINLFEIGVIDDRRYGTEK